MNNYYNTSVLSYTTRTHEDNITMRELITIILYFLASEIGRRRNTAANTVHVPTRPSKSLFNLFFSSIVRRVCFIIIYLYNI